MIKMQMKWMGNEVKAKVQKMAEQAMSDSLEFLLQEANKEVPHDEGTLQISGDIDLDKKKLQGTVFYDTPYARRLHEHPEYRFQKGRKGKWLERSFNKNSDKIRQYMISKIKF